MKKQQAKDIATALVAISGNNFDMFAFDGAGISDKDSDKILREVQSLCEKMKSKIEQKYSIMLGSYVPDIIDSILYE